MRGAAHHCKANANRGAVGDGVAAAFFYRMAEGVPKVEQPAAARVELIFAYNVPLYGNAAGYNVRILRAYVRILYHAEKLPARKHGVFDYFAAAVFVFRFRQGAERIRIAQHERRLIEAAKLVFARWQIYRSFAAD